MSARALILGLGLVGLTACGGGSDYDRSAAPPAPPPPSVSAMVAEESMAFDAIGGAKMAADESAPMPEQPAGEPSAEQYIAYSHNLGLTLPKGGVEPMMAAHTEACRAAGTATCIVINSNVYSQEEDYASGNLSIRATPDWITGFMGTVEADAESAGGEITQRSTRAEDLTRQIIDTGARLDAQKTLRGRLLGLLERRDGELGELLQIERELARVTGDIESIEAQLKTLRLRVSMSSLDINYQTKVPAFSGSRENPLGQAFGDFFYNLSGAIAAVITAFAVGLPWILLIGLFLWIWLKLIWPRLRGKNKKPRAQS
ncbi:MAG: DUF4349 domain-containing protein [Hyphomonadaceae bacterium]|nr:DUF4349 domain-containing protein [Hyphomonadaceae bacterium]